MQEFKMIYLMCDARVLHPVDTSERKTFPLNKIDNRLKLKLILHANSRKTIDTAEYRDRIIGTRYAMTI